MPRIRTLPELIRRSGHTHRSLADETGLHYTYFSKMARGQRSPSLDKAKRIAKALGVTLEELQRTWQKARSAA